MDKNLQSDIIKWIKVATSAALPLAIAFGVSAGDIETLGDAAEAAVVAGAALVAAVVHVYGDVRSKK